MIKVLIVDDEPPARANLRFLLEKFEPDCDLKEAANGVEAARLMGSFAPDLVFLDIQMPGIDGISLAGHLRENPGPKIIFVTAHRDHAVEAFELEASDYLVKPFREQRFKRALEKAKESMGFQARVTPPAVELDQDNRIRVKDGNRYFFIAVEEIAWVGSAGNYVEIHHGDQVRLMRATMTEVEQLLDGKTFIRIHRRTLVNRHFIREIQGTDHGDYTVTLSDGSDLTLSRRRKEAVCRLLGPDL